MDPFHEHLIVRAATIDELLSDDFETLPGQKGDAEHGRPAPRRLVPRMRERRLVAVQPQTGARRVDDRAGAGAICHGSPQGLRCRRPPGSVMPSGSRRRCRAPRRTPGLRRCAARPSRARSSTCLRRCVERSRPACSGPPSTPRRSSNLTDSARACLRAFAACGIVRPVRGAALRAVCPGAQGGRDAGRCIEPPREGATVRYERFVTDMQAGGFRRLFEEKPVLLRLVATHHPAMDRGLDASSSPPRCRSAQTIRRDILHRDSGGPRCENRRRSLRSAQRRTFGPASSLRGRRAGRLQAEGSAARRGLAWSDRATERGSGAPIELRAVRAIARDGYGWTEFIDACRMRRCRTAASDFSAGPAPGSRCFTASPAPTCTRRT